MVVSLPTLMGDPARHEFENLSVVVFVIYVLPPVDSQDIPLCNSRHLGKYQCNWLILLALLMEIEEETIGFSRTFDLERGGCPFGPNRRRVTGSTCPIKQQHARQTEDCPTGDVHATQPR